MGMHTTQQPVFTCSRSCCVGLAQMMGERGRAVCIKSLQTLQYIRHEKMLRVFTLEVKSDRRVAISQISCMWLLATRLQRVIWQKQGVNVAVSSLIGLQHLPHTLMTPQDPYGEILCFSLYFFIAVCSYHIHPLDGIFFHL